MIIVASFLRGKVLCCLWEAKREEWLTLKLKAFSAKMGAQNRKVALLIGHCPVHPQFSFRILN
jgi:hypothetical protein